MIKSLIKPLINIESKSDRQSGIRDHRYENLIKEFKFQIQNSKFKILTPVPKMCGTHDQKILILDHRVLDMWTQSLQVLKLLVEESQSSGTLHQPSDQIGTSNVCDPAGSNLSR